MPDTDSERTPPGKSSSIIPWKLDWRSKKFTYVGPQIELLLGWPTENWNTFEDWLVRIHPLDRERVVDLRLAQAIAGVDFECEYSIITSTGDFVLVRDVVHVARDESGEVNSLMGFMLDIRPSRAVARPDLLPDD